MQSKSLNIMISAALSAALACSLSPVVALADDEGASSWMDQAAALEAAGVLRQFPQDVPAAEGDTAEDGTRTFAQSWRYAQGYPEDVLQYVSANQNGILMGAWPDLEAGDLDIPDTWSKSDGVGRYTVRQTPTAPGRQVSVPGVLAVGIDVSVHNNQPPGRPAGPIDWAKVKADGISFVIIRCGYGSNYTNQDDKWFVDNYKGAKAAGLAVGVYLYSYAPKATGAAPSAASEADHVLRIFRDNNIKPADLAFPVYLDLEDVSQQKLPKGTLGAIAQTFCDKIKAAGYKTGIYASQYWFNEVLKRDSAVFDAAAMKKNGWSRWVARYSNGDTKPGVDGTDIWQFTCVGAVAGTPKKYCDVNFAFVNFGATGAVGTPAPAAPAAPTPAPVPAAPAVSTPAPAAASKAVSYKITYQLNGGKNAKGNPSKTADRVVLKDPTRKNYTFGGWYLDKKFKSKVTKLTAKNAKSGKVTVYAKWCKNYKVTYKLNGGKNAKGNPSKVGGPLTLKDPTRKGYVFKGWYTDKALKKKAKKLTVTKNVTLYAKWEKVKSGTYQVTGAPNGLNIRKSPSTTAEVTGSLKEKTLVRISAKKDGWGKLRDGRGWIKLEFAKKL